MAIIFILLLIMPQNVNLTHASFYIQICLQRSVPVGYSDSYWE